MRDDRAWHSKNLKLLESAETHGRRGDRIRFDLLIEAYDRAEIQRLRGKESALRKLAQE